MTSCDYELVYLRAGVSALENYLLANELYWPLDANAPAEERPYPRLTIGGLMLSRARAYACPKTSIQQDELSRLDEKIDAIRIRWRVAWERKVVQDFQARLNLWRDFLEEYRNNPETNFDRFTYEVERRVMLNLLAQEVKVLPREYLEFLEGLDKILRVVWLPGDFVWDIQIASGFPGERYWYLWGQLRR